MVMGYLKFILFFIILNISFFAPYKAYISNPPNVNFNTVDVESGDSINEVISKFSSHNLINKIFLKLYMKANQLNDFKVGEYSIKNKDMNEIISNMSNGTTITHKIIINEGMNIYQLEEIIDNSYLENDCSFLKCLDKDLPFKEGILYPDTYFYKKGMKSSLILKKSHKKLNEYVDPFFINNDRINSLNKYQVLILSSIVEKEAGNDNEKPLIASVFLKRLSINMRLQADPTIIYGLLPNFDGDIKKSDILNKNNQYNTYMINGLPPTPISISSKSSILAVINGIPGDYLFFVADSPNSHFFSKTYDEHLNKIKEIGLDK